MAKKSVEYKLRQARKGKHKANLRQRELALENRRLRAAVQETVDALTALGPRGVGYCNAFLIADHLRSVLRRDT